MPRFFADPTGIDRSSNTITLTGPDVNHIKNVLRMGPGEELWISDGDKKEYHCRIDRVSSDRIETTILYEQEPSYELPLEIVLFQCIPKGDKMDLIIQKAVELGASAVVPVDSARCIVKLDEKKAEKRLARWTQIAEGAAMQSRRMRLPQILPVMKYKDALELASGKDLFVIPYELEEGMQNTRTVFHSLAGKKSIAVLIGPDGGFEPDEVEKAREKGALPISLGKRILRTETAGMTFLSALMLCLEGAFAPDEGGTVPNNGE